MRAFTVWSPSGRNVEPVDAGGVALLHFRSMDIELRTNQPEETLRLGNVARFADGSGYGTVLHVRSTYARNPCTGYVIRLLGPSRQRADGDNPASVLERTADKKLSTV